MTDETCVIGPGILVKGTMRGQEDVVVEGAVEGSIQLDHHLTVGGEGRIKAEVAVLSCAIAGLVEGRVDAADYVSMHEGATVRAEVKAPRIVIEPGVRFVGRIEMDFTLPEDV